MAGSYNFLLLCFALLVTSLACYAALEISERVAAQEAQYRRMWLALGGVVFGLGIWAASYTTLAALRLPLAGKLGFDGRLMMLALLLSTGSAFYLLHLSALRRAGRGRLLIGGLMIGAALNAIFHISLASMQLAPAIRYNQALLLFALLATEGAAIFGIFLFSATNLRKAAAISSLHAQQIRRIVAALLVGAALIACNCLGVSASAFPMEGISRAAHAISRDHLLNGIVFGAFLMMAAALVFSGAHRNRTLKKIVGRTNDKLLHFATHDVLTGLPNRALLSERILHAIQVSRRSGKTFSVLFMDLDGFKGINDSLGHSVGDGLLVAVAQRIRACIRGEDMVARIGGDEFVVVMSNLSSPEVVEQLAENILAALRHDFQVEESTLRVTSSIGISVFPNSGESVDALMKNADAAMYEAKQSGRNTYRFFEPAMHASAMRHLTVRQALQEALEKQQFSLHFQPKYRGIHGGLNGGVNGGTSGGTNAAAAASGERELTGVEALLRWKHPELGDMSPVEFIPIAERSGQIIAIGDWVLREVCAQIKRWDEAGGKPVKVALNLSPLQMRPDLVDSIVRVVGEARISPQRLMFEITETAAMKNVERSTRIINDLQALGFDIAIDDFGTGYSSLAYLAQFHCRQIKIDRFFTSRLELSDHSGRAIVSAIIALAHALGMEVVAEGVETEHQLQELQSLNCDQVQGFLLGRPVAAPLLADVFDDCLYSAAPQQASRLH
ncbi:EAL domain-containing protein [Herbaspirillum lusitanum]|uniref:EAL domain-containing protein n=1 Tax=Herbaspirillum lusitanum TaxID=213312 RepID=A0ABW9AC14_9BURK